MKNIISIVFSLFLACSFALAQDKASKFESYPKDKVHLFLLAGQSNMAGRGKIDKTDNKPNPRVFALNKEGKWQPAVAPIHFDKSFAGEGLARSFADYYLAGQDEGIVVGLIPAACGGSSIDHWKSGVYFDSTKSHPFDDAIARTKLALKSGTLKAILWHQGEADCKPGSAQEHEAKLLDLVKRFRSDLNSPELPFIVGELGRFYSKGTIKDIASVNQALKNVADSSASIGFVSSENLTSNPDHVHFNTTSLKAFGQRYARVYQKLYTK